MTNPKHEPSQSVELGFGDELEPPVYRQYTFYDNDGNDSSEWICFDPKASGPAIVTEEVSRLLWTIIGDRYHARKARDE